MFALSEVSFPSLQPILSLGMHEWNITDETIHPKRWFGIKHRGDEINLTADRDVLPSVYWTLTVGPVEGIDLDHCGMSEENLIDATFQLRPKLIRYIGSRTSPRSKKGQDEYSSRIDIHPPHLHQAVLSWRYTRRLKPRLKEHRDQYILNLWRSLVKANAHIQQMIELSVPTQSQLLKPGHKIMKARMAKLVRVVPSLASYAKDVDRSLEAIKTTLSLEIGKEWRPYLDHPADSNIDITETAVQVSVSVNRRGIKSVDLTIEALSNEADGRSIAIKFLKDVLGVVPDAALEPGTARELRLDAKACPELSTDWFRDDAKPAIMALIEYANCIQTFRAGFERVLKLFQESELEEASVILV